MEKNDALKHLFTELFSKVEQEINNKSKNPCAEYMKAKLFPKGVSAKTLVRYRDRYIDGELNEAGEPLRSHLDSYAQYLEFKSYADFEATFYGRNESIPNEEKTKNIEKEPLEEADKNERSKQSDENEAVGSKVIPVKISKEKGEGANQIDEHKKVPTKVVPPVSLEVEKVNEKNRARKFFLLFFLLVILGGIGWYIYAHYEQKGDNVCVIWVEDHYEKTTCENGQESNDQIDVSDENEWNELKEKRKIEFEKDQPYKDENGAPIIWYSYTQNNYVFFNFPGVDPETGEELKPVTQEFVANYFDIDIDASTNIETVIQNESSISTPDDEVVDNDIPEIITTQEPETKPPCEANNTGSICFKNSGSQPLLVQLLRIGNDSRNTFELRLNNMEKKCLEKYDTGIYKYSVYVAATHKLIEQSEFSLNQCQEKSMFFEAPKEVQRIETPVEVKKTPKCETEELGDYCFTNKGNETMHITISDYSPTSPLSHRYLKLDVNPGQTGCYYDVPIGAYNVEVFVKSKMMPSYSKVKVKMCEEGHSDLP